MLSASLLVEIFDFRFLIALKMGVADFKFDFFTGILPPFTKQLKFGQLLQNKISLFSLNWYFVHQ